MFEHLLCSYGSAVVCRRDRGSGCGYGISILGGKGQNLVCRIQEEGGVTPQETDQDLPVSVQEFLVEAWVAGGQLQGWGPRL